MTEDEDYQFPEFQENSEQMKKRAQRRRSRGSRKRSSQLASKTDIFDSDSDPENGPQVFLQYTFPSEEDLGPCWPNLGLWDYREKLGIGDYDTPFDIGITEISYEIGFMGFQSKLNMIIGFRLQPV